MEECFASEASNDVEKYEVGVTKMCQNCSFCLQCSDYNWRGCLVLDHSASSYTCSCETKNPLCCRRQSKKYSSDGTFTNLTKLYYEVQNSRVPLQRFKVQVALIVGNNVGPLNPADLELATVHGMVMKCASMWQQIWGLVGKYWISEGHLMEHCHSRIDNTGRFGSRAFISCLLAQLR